MRARTAASMGLLLMLAACREHREPVTDPARLEPRPQERAEPSAMPTEPPPTEAPATQAPAVQTGDQRAPDQFTVRLDTTEGPLLIDVTRAWAPYGADRFYTLVREGYFTDVAFFRVVDGFMAQAGIHGDPAMNTRWRNRSIPDDPVRQSNTRGMVSFAMAGPNSRTTQFFINFVDNSRLDSMGFAPFGRVRDMAVVDRLHDGYGESAPAGNGPIQGQMQAQGNTYLRAQFPELDYIRSASIEP